MAHVQFRADKRTNRGRFGWVRRLVQGQNRQTIDGLSTEPRSSQNVERNRSRSAPITITPADNDGFEEYLEAGEKTEVTSNSDNASTTPLKSILSFQSTKAASIISNGSHGQSSVVASTAETSLAPSVFTNMTQVPHSAASQLQERDSESIVTLASSSRRMRRRSLDTNSSMTGIPPASIVEKFTVHPAAASLYAVSVKTVDRGEQHDFETESVHNCHKKEQEEDTSEQKEIQKDSKSPNEQDEDDVEEGGKDDELKEFGADQNEDNQEVNDVSRNETHAAI